MTEKIKINGFEKSKLCNLKDCNIYKQLKRLENEYEGFAVKYTDMEIALKRKEEECEELKEKYLELKEQNGSNIVQLNTANEQLDQLKAEKKEVNDFLTDIASYISYNGETPTNLNEVRICIKDICKANQILDKNAKLYRQTLTEIKEMCKQKLPAGLSAQNCYESFEAFTGYILQKCEAQNE